ncbi:MAG: hypothetical protein JST54_12890 [Deltaproteobacteria bacterium]|nr:hypothetical protein [Deltaproteobacteria bacterium]
MITADVQRALEELRTTFGADSVSHAEDGAGGAHVTVTGLEPGAQYGPRPVSVRFTIAFTYPASDVYPHLISPPLVRVDGQQLGSGLSQTNLNGTPVTQVSRRSNHWDANTDTAAIKLQKVLEWLRKS